MNGLESESPGRDHLTFTKSESLCGSHGPRIMKNLQETVELDVMWRGGKKPASTRGWRRDRRRVTKAGEEALPLGAWHAPGALLAFSHELRAAAVPRAWRHPCFMGRETGLQQ